MQAEAYVQGQLVQGSLLNVVRHVINKLDIVSVKLCLFRFLLSRLLYLGQRKNERIFFCLFSSAYLPRIPPVVTCILAVSLGILGCYWCL